MTKTKVLLIACQFSVWCQQNPWEYDWLFKGDENEGWTNTIRDDLEPLDLGSEWLRDAGAQSRRLGAQDGVSAGI